MFSKKETSKYKIVRIQGKKVHLCHSLFSPHPPFSKFLSFFQKFEEKYPRVTSSLWVKAKSNSHSGFVVVIWVFFAGFFYSEITIYFGSFETESPLK
jgi:hypothetical protein